MEILYTSGKYATTMEGEIEQQQPQSHIITLLPPNAKFLKCNVDAPFSHNRDLVGISICVRVWSMQWIIEMGLEDVVFELDAELVADSFHNPQNK